MTHSLTTLLLLYCDFYALLFWRCAFHTSDFETTLISAKLVLLKLGSIVLNLFIIS